MSITSGLTPVRRYADGGDADSGFFNYQKTAEGSGANLRDFTDFIFDPTDPVDYLVAGLMIFPPAGIAAKLIQAGVKGKKLKDTMKKVDALKNAERGAGQKAKDLFTTNPAENIASANGLLLGPTRKTIPGAIGQLTLRNEAADLVTTNNRGIENIGPIELYSDEALAEIREDPSITKKGGIGELVEMGRDTKELYDLAKDPEIRGSMIDDMKSGIGNFFSGDQSTIDNDALDDATEDLDIVNAEEKELTRKEKGINAFASFAKALGDSQGEYTGTPGYMIEGIGASTPEITRYQGGGIANIDPMMMADGGDGGMNFMKMLSSFGGKDEEDEEEEEGGLGAFLKALGDSGKEYSSTKGYTIQGMGAATPEIKRYEDGGIANMEPMMMAGGGIAKFGVGGTAKKLAKDKLDKLKNEYKKRKKAIEEKREAPKKSTKKSKSKDLVPYDEARAADAAAKRSRGFFDFLPTPIVALSSTAGRGAGKIAEGAMEYGRPIAGASGLGLGAAGIYGLSQLGDKEQTAEEKAKAQALLDKANAEKAYKERQEAREGLTSMPDIIRARSLERAEAAGRSEPTFVDYIASFPASYSEKIGKDPEFAKQMMAGFAAMGKTTEGYVTRNAFTDFTQGVQEERIRQEEGTPDQLKLIDYS